MLLTQANYTAANTYLTGANVTAIAQKVLNASVMLSGSAGASGSFTGSATILGTGTEVSYVNGKWTPTGKHFTLVVTCKHSLFTQGNGGKVPDTGGSPNAAKWDDDLVAGFKAVKICYSDAGTNGFGSNLTKTAAIDHVVPIFEENYNVATKTIVIPVSASSDGTSFPLVNLTGTTTPTGSGTIGGSGGISPAEPGTGWAYDVMILLSKDPGLYAFASTAGTCDFQAGVTQDVLVAKLGAHYTTDPSGLVPVLGVTNVQLVQTGFGKPSEQLAPKGKPNDPKITLPALLKAAAQYERLQYKLSTPDAKLEAAHFYETLPGNSGDLTLTNSHGFILRCDGGNNSTNSGDSGGGVFAMKRVPTVPITQAILAAVATGSAAATSADAAPAMWDFDNNVVTSLGFYYEYLFNLRYQNV
jgi:hypothetical protein